VNADTGQIEQVLMNLTTNARDAMPNGGILSLRTKIVEQPSSGRASVTEKHTAYALITVADTGIGMDDATREKIFEPFFTTKDLGRGTGLGLAMVYGIIQQHGGHIECTSESGKGTTFRIYLPLTSTEYKREAGRETLSTNAEHLRGSETILIVEDDESVRTLSKLALESFGYKVIEAADGDAAITLYREHHDTIRLVLCDVIMPKKNGAEVLKTISQEAPGVRFLFMSGYPADTVHRQNILNQGTEVIAKPISPSTLLNKVREALDRT
jgi:CheY-like chemotaxis protein